MSTDYYTRLEQGKLSGASSSALDAISRALLLTSDQREYLYQLANKVTKRNDDITTAGNLVHPLTQQLLDKLVNTAALVVDQHMNILAWNELASSFYLDFGTLRDSERNLVRLMFLHPDVRDRYADWETSARDCVAFLRMDSVERPDSAELSCLVDELNASSHEFRKWWTSYDVAAKTAGTKRFRHPVVGVVSLDWQFLSPMHEPRHFLLAMTARPGSQSEKAIRFLGSWKRESGERWPPAIRAVGDSK